MALDTTKPYMMFKSVDTPMLYYQDGKVYAENGEEIPKEKVVEIISPIDAPLLYKLLDLISDEDYKLICTLNAQESMQAFGVVITPEELEETVLSLIEEEGIHQEIVKKAIELLRKQKEGKKRRVKA
jgi:hypothetical protein